MREPISLSDLELQAVMDACRPLAPRDRDRFLRSIAEAICALPEDARGPGSVYRVIKSVFRLNFDAPDLRTSEPRSRAY
jgi:hypothetical protein